MSRKDDITKLVDDYFRMDSPSDGLPLAVSPIGKAEITAAIDTLLSGWLTMGQKVLEFESAWADAVGTRHAICVNSGSSALLVMFTAPSKKESLGSASESSSEMSSLVSPTWSVFGTFCSSD